MDLKQKWIKWCTHHRMISDCKETKHSAVSQLILTQFHAKFCLLHWHIAAILWRKNRREKDVVHTWDDHNARPSQPISANVGKHSPSIVHLKYGTVANNQRKSGNRLWLNVAHCHAWLYTWLFITPIVTRIAIRLYDIAAENHYST